MAILVKEASKLTFGKDLQVVAPHAVETLLHSPPVILLDPPRVSFLKTTALNPATLFPDEEAETPLQDCEETLTSLRADLTDQPISNPEETLFTDGSSFVEDGVWYAGAAVVTQERVIWAQSLGHGTSFSTEGRTHSPHPCLTAEKRTRESISTRTPFGALKKLQSYNSPVTKGNQFADKWLKKTAKRPAGPLEVLAAIPTQNLEPNPRYTPKEEDIARRCQICAQVNPGPPITAPPGTRFRGSSPGEHWEVDFTELPSGLGGTDISCVCGHFLWWPEAYPTRAGTAQVVVKKLLSEILPRFGLPLFMGSDNGPAFIAKVTQSLVKALTVTWKLHCVCRPQSSGQVERMNRTLKDTLTKLKVETGENWVSLLPIYPTQGSLYPICKRADSF
ncbi:hypothetical protein QTO34_003860 [Cnephaeus nilssonii]|uniref:Integrase catalytic domain-containing protein n=1 Tax=Cnephaeus nilssonii TaxID=3371016 RepID=A0AA40LK97_CNENI|nr:hypothetical protein QTO34_003860 [Eptesicus nilssonii]